jgi:hypothetical protein
MDTQTFREAPIEHDISDTNKSISDNKYEVEGTVNSDLPFSQYSAFNQVPYSVNFFKVDNYEHLNDITDIDGIRGKIETIENYIMKQIEENNLQDKLTTYNDIIESFMESIGIDKNETDISKLFKISKYIGMVGRKSPMDIKKDLIRKQEAMNESFSSKEKKYQEKVEKIKSEKDSIMSELTKLKNATRLLEKEKNDNEEKVKSYKDIINKYINQ